MRPQTAESSDPGDIELVRAFQAGSVEAFDQLFIRYHQPISGLTNRLVRDQLLAEDLVQETFFRVLRSLDRVDEGFNFSAWIHRIATNLCYDELRRRKRGQGQTNPEEGPRATPTVVGIDGPDEVLRSIPSTDLAGHPEDALAMRELRREVWDVAAKLPENYRTVLSLRELQGLTYSGIAQVMGLSESAIETLLHRARKRFKAEYLYMGFVDADGEDKCMGLQELLGSIPARSLRRSQRLLVKQHVDTCSFCQAALTPATSEGGEADESVDPEAEAG
ncbi:MAG: sigma-70 family RNA polymerase sigma factor [Candidatus Dormibacteraeota bacterium]|nr:sigma-70 family RNA polymerase sigma factor [Candidatus Dormibacteraeota bacterium]